MAAAPIDLSGGFVAKPQQQGQGVDLSGGFVPKAAAQASQPQQQGLLSSFADTSGLSMLGHALMHLQDTAGTVLDAGKQIFTPANANVPLSQSSNPLLKGIGQQIDYTKQHAKAAVADFQNGGMKNPQLGEDVMKAIPVAGSVYDKAASQSDAGNYAGAAGTVLGLGAGMVGPEYAAKGLQAAAPAVSQVIAHPLETAVSPLRSGLDEPIAGTSLTPRQRYQSAQNLGVQLDAADATNHPLLTSAKALNQHSLLGSPTYEAAKARNLGQLNTGTDNLLNQASPIGDLQGRGSLVQNNLRANQQGLRSGADAGFSSLDAMTGGAPVPGASAVGQYTRNMLDQNQGFFTKFPSFEPTTPVRILKDLSKVDDTASYSDLQRLRSNTYEATQNNNDLVKDQGTAMLQQATGQLDTAITSNGLTPAQTAVFRDANAKWADLKSTYDDPSSPFYSAVRNATPESLAGGVGSPSATNVQGLFPRISPEAQGAVQRTVAEKLLGSNATGDPRFQGFGQRLYAQPEGYRDALFTPEQNQTLGDIANTTHALNADLNPSGSAKQLQKYGDVTAFGSSLTAAALGHPVPLIGDMLYNAAQYGGAKLLNSPRFTNFLMRDPGAAGGGGGLLSFPGGGGGRGEPVYDPGVDYDAYGPRGLEGYLDSQIPSRPGSGTAPAFGSSLRRGAPGQSPSLRPIATPAESLMGGRGSTAFAQPVAPGARLGGVDGAQTQLLLPSGSLPARYRAVEADSLIPSHNATNFQPDLRYPAGVQERDYLQRENQLRVIQNAQGYKPSLTINDDPTGTNGPPITLPDGTVLGGNSRTMSTQRLYANDGSPYKQMLMDKAASFGLSPEALGAMRNPMLVREVSPAGGVDGMRQLGSALNKPLTGAMSGSEKAVSMGKNISPATLQSVQSMIDAAGPGASLRDVMSDPASANNFLQKMQADGIITSAERPQYVESGTGGMTPEGKMLFEKALLGSAVGSSALMDAAPKNILAKLNSSIGPLSSLAARGDEFNLTPAVQRAIQEHAKMATTGMNVDDHFAQQSMFGNDITPAEEQMTRVLAQNPNAVRDAFSSFAKDALQSPEGQASFLGGAPTPEDAWQRAFGPFLPGRGRAK